MTTPPDNPLDDLDQTSPMNDPSASPETLVTLTVQPTEFHANTIVALLQDHGIEAHAFGTGTSWLGLAMWANLGGLRGVPVQVQQKNLHAAQDIINKRKAESVDIDWDELDVGEPDKSSTQQSTTTRTPVLAQLSFVVAVAIVIVTIIGLILVFILP